MSGDHSRVSWLWSIWNYFKDLCVWVFCGPSDQRKEKGESDPSLHEKETDSKEEKSIIPEDEQKQIT